MYRPQADISEMGTVPDLPAAGSGTDSGVWWPVGCHARRLRLLEK